jgi:hypothetical protein
MSRVGWSLNLPPTLDHLPHSFAILPSYAVPVRRYMPGWWRGHPGRSCFLVRPSRDRRSSRAHVRTNAARARTCRGRVVSASIRRTQFLKGNHRLRLWGKSSHSWIAGVSAGQRRLRSFPGPLPNGEVRPLRAIPDSIGGWSGRPESGHPRQTTRHADGRFTSVRPAAPSPLSNWRCRSLR